jgi:ABC-type glycerol-3-phosphate transport system permease component
MFFGIFSDSPMPMNSMMTLIVSMLCAMMGTYGLSKFPIKGTQVMGAMAACCLCSCSSSGILGNDIRKRF